MPRNDGSVPSRDYVAYGSGCTNRDEAQRTKGASKPEERRLRGAVLILLDTVRADHLSCYRYQRLTSPNIDALSKKSVQFLQVVAPSP